MHVFDRLAVGLHLALPQSLMHVFDRGSPHDPVALHLFNPHSPQTAAQDLVNAGHDPPWDKLNVAVPVLSVLPPALLLVTPLAMHKQDREVDHEKVGENHAPALGAIRYDILAVAVLKEVCVGLGGSDGVLSNVMDDVSR